MYSKQGARQAHVTSWLVSMATKMSAILLAGAACYSIAEGMILTLWSVFLKERKRESHWSFGTRGKVMHKT